jgi:hypothetical protein
MDLETPPQKHEHHPPASPPPHHPQSTPSHPPMNPLHCNHEHGRDDGHRRTQTNQIKSNQIKSNQIKSNQIKSNQPTDQRMNKQTNKQKQTTNTPAVVPRKKLLLAHELLSHAEC